jgi:quercetin dioxygenase-like cupin family protein
MNAPSRGAFGFALAAVLLSVSAPSRAATNPVVSSPPQLILNTTTPDLPKTPVARVRVFTGSLAPGEVTFWHVHDSPLVVYVEAGTGTWEFKDGRRAETGRAGQAVLEPAHAIVRLANHGSVPVRVVMIQASKPNEPMMHPSH